MNYFRCTVGGVSGKWKLTVTCTNVFAGLTITCTDGTTTLTKTCPSASPYTVVFNIPNGGTWTISGVYGGKTNTTTVVIPDTATLVYIPTGSTATPTNDIQTWLHCANIWNKNYTAIAQVLADTTTLLALISSNNAVDYMVRSTNWASSVCANATAMGYIGNNNYCANKLLANSTWRTAICNSTYFESVLNVKVPTMTSDTIPSGVASASSVWQYGYEAFRAFNGNTSQIAGWIASTSNAGEYLTYKFPSAVKPYFFNYKGGTYTGVNGLAKFKIQGSTNGTSYVDLTNEITNSDATLHSKNQITKNIGTAYQYFRLITTASTGTNAYCGVAVLQFYGRA